MWKDAAVRMFIVGTGSKCASFIESIRWIPGIEITGMVDPVPSRECLDISKSLGASLYRRLEEAGAGEDIDVILNASEDEAVAGELRRKKPEGAVIVEGAGARFIRILAEGYGETRRADEQALAHRHNFDSYEHRSERIIGKSQGIQDVRELIAKVAPTPATVLLLGETGTGKDLVARCLHRAGSRAEKPFIAVNCTALTSSLIESELFGYTKGAFTGAEEDRKGLLEEADGGTVFLDEIGDMLPELQAKLLRFLQTGEIRRVGSSNPVTVDVRVIAATNRDLDKAMDDGDFRRDLYYRFNAFSIDLPPLRERRQDIPYLAYHFLTKAEAKLNKRVEAISEESLQLLGSYEWPGNVRELENVIERAVILCDGKKIMPRDLPIQVSCVEPRPVAGAEFSENKKKIIDEFEKKELLNYLKRAGGNVSEASRMSEIPRRTFYRLMKRHGISAEAERAAAGTE